jgi:hypothetical protein
MTVPRVEVLPIEQGATPDSQNVNKHTQRGGGLLENSLRKRGAFRSIASAGKDTNTPVVYAGNYTLQKAVEAGFTEIINVHVTGNQIVNVVRDDIAPGSAQAIALGLEDNEVGRISYNPDIDILAAVMADSAMQALRTEDKMLADIVEGMKPQQIDYAAEWRGMPEFEQQDLSAWKSIIIHFDTAENLHNFSELIDQNLTEKTKSIWYPKKEREDLLSLVAHAES